MRTFLIWAVLGAINGFISSIFFSVFTWQFWVLTFVIFILLLIIECTFFKDGL